MNISRMFFFASTCFISGCYAPQLTPLNHGSSQLSYVDVNAKICTLPRAVAKQKVKYLFVVDHSQSNQPGFPLTPSDTTSTDTSGARRYGPLSSFINNLTADPNNLTYFSIIDFSDLASQPLGLSGFDNDANHFLSTYVTPDWIGTGTALAPVPFDHGFTNYQAALSLAYILIRDDATTESLLVQSPVVSVSYQIILVSDGIPIILSAGPSTTYTQTFLTDISPVITSIMGLISSPALAPYISGITLSTAYYYQNAPIVAAETLLSQMATAGNGQYFEFGTGESIVYQAFAPPIRNIKYNLSDIWVENTNVVSWDDGRLLQDSDGDGIPDVVETQLGSLPFAVDSDGNGVSDLVEYRTKGRPCSGLNCNRALRDPYSICDGFSPTVASDGTVTFPHSSNDGLNDCEKFVLGIDLTGFDGNGDFIPDFFAFKNSIPYLSGTSGTYLNPFGDPLNQYQKLKAGYPLSVSQSSVYSGFIPRSNFLEHTDSESSDIECYSYTSSNVAVLQPGNILKVSVIQNNSLIDNKPILQSASVPWNGKDTVISINRGDFK